MKYEILMKYELQNMTNTLGRLQVAWQMWNQLFIEDAHLVAGSVRDDQLGNMGE